MTDNEIIGHVMDRSLIMPDRLRNLMRAVRRTAHLPGDMAELGVFSGGSAYVIAQTCPSKTLHLFDTFAGLPFDEDENRDPQGYVRKGMYACPERDVLEYLCGCRVQTHAGLFPHSMANMDREFSFVHVDCDLHDTARAALQWFWPCLVKGGIMFFDDYGCLFTGVTEVVDAAWEPGGIERQYDDAGAPTIGCAVVKR
jgi:predicted O-methyltransferase YrrM